MGGHWMVSRGLSKGRGGYESLVTVSPLNFPSHSLPKSASSSFSLMRLARGYLRVSQPW